MMFARNILVVDDDVDVQNLSEVAWRALANVDARARPVDRATARSTCWTTPRRTPLIGGKLGIDATRKTRRPTATRARLAARHRDERPRSSELVDCSAGRSTDFEVCVTRRRRTALVSCSRTSSSSTRSSRFPSPTSGWCWRRAAGRPGTSSSGSRVAMVAARTLAMSLNRVIDREIDARNPRTAGRPVPSGRLSARLVWPVAAISSARSNASPPGQLGPLPLKLLPIALVFLVGYHHVKRFISALPPGARHHRWRRAARRLGGGERQRSSRPRCCWPGGGVLGRRLRPDLRLPGRRVRSRQRPALRPGRLRRADAIWMARSWHALTLMLLAASGFWQAWAGCTGSAGPPPRYYWLYEHGLVSPSDLSRIGMAFFNVNGYLAVGVFVFTLAAVLIR